MIAKWRALQDLSLLSIGYGFASDVLETDRMSEEAQARAKILEATQETLDARLARGRRSQLTGSAVKSRRSIKKRVLSRVPVIV